MLKIQRSANGRVVFTLSGRIEAEDVTRQRRALCGPLGQRDSLVIKRLKSKNDEQIFQA